MRFGGAAARCQSGACRNESGWSKTRLVSTFSAQVGVSPKQYARVMRFSRALQQIHAASGTLSDVAADAGYYDQPHMNSEFKELSGFTPARIPELAPLSQQRQRRRSLVAGPLVRPFFQDVRHRLVR